ncbi:MAG: tetratricopeptide repeat protein [Calditrichaeota bacterium]|nr:tetratricopeptide repeat protein [Calditrichota bacterium]
MSAPSRNLSRKAAALQKLLPQHPLLFPRLAEYYLHLGKPKPAAEILAEGLKEHPDLAAGWVVKGYLHSQLRQTKLARLAFEQALKIDPSNPAAHHYCIDIALEEEDDIGLLEHLRALAELDALDDNIQIRYQTALLRKTALESGHFRRQDVLRLTPQSLRQELLRAGLLPPELARRSERFSTSDSPVVAPVVATESVAAASPPPPATSRERPKLAWDGIDVEKEEIGFRTGRPIVPPAEEFRTPITPGDEEPEPDESDGGTIVRVSWADAIAGQSGSPLVEIPDDQYEDSASGGEIEDFEPVAEEQIAASSQFRESEPEPEPPDVPAPEPPSLADDEPRSTAARPPASGEPIRPPSADIRSTLLQRIGAQPSRPSTVGAEESGEESDRLLPLPGKLALPKLPDRPPARTVARPPLTDLKPRRSDFKPEPEPAQPEEFIAPVAASAPEEAFGLARDEAPIVRLLKARRTVIEPSAPPSDEPPSEPVVEASAEATPPRPVLISPIDEIMESKPESHAVSESAPLMSAIESATGFDAEAEAESATEEPVARLAGLQSSPIEATDFSAPPVEPPAIEEAQSIPLIEEEPLAPPPEVKARETEARKRLAEVARSVTAKKPTSKSMPSAAKPPEEEKQKAKIATKTLAELYASQGDWARAIEVYQALLEKFPTNEAYLRRLEQLKAKKGE